jgi:tetraprenyl-beta-curcumene synthase
MPPAGTVDPTPLSPGQVRALVAAAARELSWGLPAVARETRAWRAMAESIPAAPIREDALRSLATKRGHADGAALFTILPRRRDRSLLALLVAYETIVDFLDCVSERCPTRANGEQLHRALADALDPGGPLRDYYRHHPWRDDGGYLLALVSACRAGCRALPSFERVRPLVRREARRALVLGMNHEVDAGRRDAALRAWAAREFPAERELRWFELSGAASATLVVHVLLTLAAEPAVPERAVAAAYRAHWPWIALATTMLDSYVDRAEDLASGDHAYIAHYADHDAALARVRESIGKALGAAAELRNGHRHVVIVGCMIALYLSKESARAPELRAATASLVEAGGSLVRLLLPILRAWRAIDDRRRA